MNSLNKALFNDFIGIFGELQKNNEVKAIVIRSAKPDCFIAGADIKFE